MKYFLNEWEKFVEDILKDFLEKVLNKTPVSEGIPGEMIEGIPRRFSKESLKVFFKKLARNC